MTPFQTAPLFILYESRSGSTFLANLLTQNLHLAIPPETNFMVKLFDKYRKDTVDQAEDLERLVQILFMDRKFPDLGVSAEQLRRVIQLPTTVRAVIDAVLTLFGAAHCPDALAWGIKKGNYAFYYQKIVSLYPQAAFIGLIRDGRGVFNSQKVSIYSGTGAPFQTHPVQAARAWVRMVEQLREIERNHANTLIVHYESLIHDPQSTIQAIVTRFSLQGLLRQERGEGGYFIPERYGSLHKNINQNPLRGRIAAWEQTLPPEEILAFESIAHPALLNEGYALVNGECVGNGWPHVKHRLHARMLDWWDGVRLRSV